MIVDSFAETPESFEQILSAEWKSGIAQTIYVLLQTGAITLSTETGAQKPDLNAEITVDTLDRVKTSRDLRTAQEESPVASLSSDEVSSVFGNVVDSFVQHGVLSKDVKLLVSQIIQPSDVFPSNSGFARFHHFGDLFPTSSEQRGTLEIGQKVFDTLFYRYQKICSEVGIDLCPAQVRLLTLQIILSHEFGHAVDHTKELQEIKSLQGDPSFAYLGQVVNHVHRKHRSEIYEHVAPNEELKRIFTDEVPNILGDNDPTYSSSERIATGFEELGAQIALMELGVSSEQIIKFVQRTRDIRRLQLDEFMKTINLARSKGFSLGTLNESVSKAYLYLSKNGRKDLAELVRGGFNARVVGYYFPLTKTQLQEFCAL